jgi:hypothetical protein
VQLAAEQRQLHGAGEPLVHHSVVHPVDSPERDAQLVEQGAGATEVAWEERGGDEVGQSDTNLTCGPSR